MPCLAGGPVLWKGRRRRLLGLALALAGLAAVGGAVLWWGSPVAVPFPGRALPALRVRPDMILLGVRVIEDRAGERIWEAAAERATVFEREARTLLTRGAEPVRITLYSEGRRLESVADRVTVRTDRREMVLEGGIVARSDQGVTLRTERLTWSGERRRLETDAPVTLERAGLIIDGEGMEADLTLERLRLKVHRGSRVTGEKAGRS